MSVVRLYKNCILSKDKNYLLDDENGVPKLHVYLGTLSRLQITEFQYIKHGLSISIKINKNQTNLDMIDANDYNYCEIFNFDSSDRAEKSYFYFITSKKWISQNTIEYVLVMDTLNTFRFNVDYILNAKTLVKRMHKDRFENIQPDDRDGFLTRKIDLKSEEINVPTYKISETTLYELEGNFVNSWALYYKNRSDQADEPIDCYLTSDEEMTFLTETGSNTITASDIPSGKMLFLSPQMSGDITISVDGQNFRCYEQEEFIGNSPGYFCIVIVNNNNVLTFNRFVYSPLGTKIVRYNSYTITIVNPTTIQIESSITTLTGRQDEPPALNEYYGIPLTENPFYPQGANKTITLAPLTTRTLASSVTIDKTLNENVKIINLPYCPSQITEDNGNFIIEELWKYDTTSKFFKLEDFSRKFKNAVVSNVEDITKDFLRFVPDYDLLNGHAFRSIKDSKLFHSDYYRPKFVYDSFTKVFPLEQIQFIFEQEMTSHLKRFEFDFVMSRNIVSKFLFKFNYTYKYANEDYPNIVAVARNNEEVLYNSQYLNYIRTGYNYDLKSKERQEVASGIGIGLNVAGLVASLGLSLIPGGQTIGIGGAIASGLGLVGQLVNYAKTTAQNEENIQRKLQETQMQSVSVLNADDYDLLYQYTQNKAKLCYYKVSERMEEILDDLFYYGGYLINEQMIPDVHSRFWFNYLQASLVLNETANLTTEVEDDIKERFEQGVTFFHLRFNTFDLNQTKENIEVFLYRPEEE